MLESGPSPLFHGALPCVGRDTIRVDTINSENVAELKFVWHIHVIMDSLMTCSYGDTLFYFPR